MRETYSRRDIPIEVRDSFLALLKNYRAAEKELTELDFKRGEVLAQLDKLRRAMNILHPQELAPYNKELSWKEKIIWVLKNTDRLIPASAIVSRIKGLEENLEVSIDPIVRLTIKRMGEKNEIIKYEDDNLSNIHYGLPEWFAKGKLLEAYYF